MIGSGQSGRAGLELGLRDHQLFRTKAVAIEALDRVENCVIATTAHVVHDCRDPILKLGALGRAALLQRGETRGEARVTGRDPLD